jgi:hypothetical protein
METINALRVELAERLEELPAALHSSFPDLGVDFLHHVFSDVMDRDSVPNDGGDDGADGDSGDGGDDGVANGTFGRVRRSRKAQSAQARVERTHQATPRSSKRLISRSNTTVGENSDSADDATTAPESLESLESLELLEKDRDELREVFERALEHIDRIKVESARLEEAALSVGARNLVKTGPIHLVRCAACGKTIASHATRAHTSHCLALRRETDAQTATSGAAYTNDTASEMNGRARPTAFVVKSNIAPIKTRGGPGEQRGGMPLSPVSIGLAAQSARQMRSFQGVPNLNLPDVIHLPSPRSQYEPT